MTKKKLGHITDNPRFLAFRAAVEATGHGLGILWTASDGIYIMAVTGPGDVAHRTIVVRDYGDDNGFGVWLESRTGAYDAGVEEILNGYSDKVAEMNRAA